MCGAIHFLCNAMRERPARLASTARSRHDSYAGFSPPPPLSLQKPRINDSRSREIGQVLPNLQSLARPWHGDCEMRNRKSSNLTVGLMWYYAARRLLLAIPIALGVTIICFGLVYLAPGDPVQLLLPPD